MVLFISIKMFKAGSLASTGSATNAQPPQPPTFTRGRWLRQAQPLHTPFSFGWFRLASTGSATVASSKPDFFTNPTIHYFCRYARKKQLKLLFCFAMMSL